MTKNKKRKRSERERDAEHHRCGECGKPEADNFCGAWINSVGTGRECHKPLHQACAGDVRGDVWRCKDCMRPKGITQREWEKMNDPKERVF